MGRRSGERYEDTIDVAGKPEEVLHGFIHAVTGERECTVNQVGPGAVVVNRRYYPTWALILCVVLSPIGLLALFARETETLTITATPTPMGTTVAISGVAKAEVANALDDHIDALAKSA